VATQDGEPKVCIDGQLSAWRCSAQAEVLHGRARSPDKQRKHAKAEAADLSAGAPRSLTAFPTGSRCSRSRRDQPWPVAVDYSAMTNDDNCRESGVN